MGTVTDPSVPLTTQQSQSRPLDARQLEIKIPVGTVFKVVATLAIISILGHLWPLLMLLFLSALLAVTLEPLVIKLERLMPRWLSIFGITVFVGLLVVGGTALVLPTLLDQISAVVQHVPNFTKTLLSKLPQTGVVRTIGEKMIKDTAGQDVASWLGQILTFGQIAVGGLSSLVLIYVMMIYLLLDGRRAYEWLVAFFPIGIRTKIRKTVPELTEVISAYVIGQVITSVLCAVYVFILLRVFHVPAALMLAVLAGIFDILPIIGFFLTAIPAVIFALTVSPTTALIIFAMYLVYHGIESYLILPYIYGNRLRVSGLIVLLALLFGAAVAGILGAIAVLPVIASYPIIERIWLVNFLGRRVIEKHEEAEENDHSSAVPAPV
jgi:predicted PurR-regulated permease PerM